jgi:hypothetical protein
VTEQGRDRAGRVLRLDGELTQSRAAPRTISSTLMQTPVRRISSSEARSAGRLVTVSSVWRSSTSVFKISSRSSSGSEARMALPVDVACKGRRSPTPAA